MSDLVYRVDVTGLNSGGVPTTFSYATADYSTTPAGAPANTHYAEKVTNPGLPLRTLFGPGRTRGRVEIPSGAVVLANEDGALDALNGYAFEAQTVAVYKVTPPNLASLIFQGGLEQPFFDFDSIKFPLRDSIYKLEKALLTTKYAGTNVLPAGIEGTAADIKGQPKPLCLGTVKNISPVCVNTSRLIYQVDGLVGLLTGWTMTAYDKRVALTAGANYVSQADMEATAPAAGGFRVWPAGGCLRLGSTPTGQVTCDVNNPLTNWDSFVGGTSSGVASIAHKVLQLLGAELFAFVATTISSSALPVVGLYLRDETSGSEALEMVLSSVGCNRYSPAQSSVSAITQVYARQLYAPGVSSLSLDETNIESGSIKRITPSDAERDVPIWRVNVSYQKNWTVMSATDLAGVAVADQAFCAAEYRVVSASDAAVLTQFPNARELSIVTLLDTSVDAAFEASRLLALFKVRRDMYEVTVAEELVLGTVYTVGYGGADIGNTVTLTTPRFGMSAGKLFLVIGIQHNFSKRTATLTLWG